MNTYDLQRAIRDDSSLNAGEVAVLFVLSTYLPHAAPSVAAIAQGCRMTAKSVRRILRRLDGRWIKRTQRAGKRTLYTFDPPLENPPLETPGVFEYQGAFRGTHPPLETPPEETRKRQEQETNNQTDCRTRESTADSHAGLVELDSDLLVEEQTVVTPPPIPNAPSSWMDKWADAWGQVCGQIPMPPEAQVKALHCDELRFAAALARVASMKHGGQLRSARKAFFGTLRKLSEKDDHEISAWTPAGVMQELEGEKVKTSVPYHRPAPPPTPELTEEEREATRAAMRQWVMTPSGDFLHIDSPEYKQYQEALARRGVAA